VARGAKTDDGPKMQATLIRFGPDLFAELKDEARRTGVSVAQYVREAVVARMAYTAGLRADPRYRADIEPAELRAIAERLRAEAARVRSESSAVRAESSQAKGHSRQIHERASGPSHPSR
jgi:hypothetical protein